MTVFRSSGTDISILDITVTAVLAILGAAMVLPLVRPLEALARAMHRLAGGDMAAEVPSTRRGDELGRPTDLAVPRG